MKAIDDVFKVQVLRCVMPYAIREVPALALVCRGLWTEGWNQLASHPLLHMLRCYANYFKCAWPCIYCVSEMAKDLVTIQKYWQEQSDENDAIFNIPCWVHLVDLWQASSQDIDQLLISSLKPDVVKRWTSYGERINARSMPRTFPQPRVAEVLLHLCCSTYENDFEEYAHPGQFFTRDIIIIMGQTDSTMQLAIVAFLEKRGDIVDAIIALVR